MKKTLAFLAIIVIFQSAECYALSDSLNSYTEKEILKLSSIIYELEKRDSIASANEPNGFGLKDKNSISNPSLLIDLNNDSVHQYTGLEVIKLSNYIFELERRDSIRTAALAAKELLANEAQNSSVQTTYSVQIGAYRRNPKRNGVKEFHKYAKPDGVKKYLSGDFKTRIEAEQRKTELLKMGINEAYVVIFINGTPVN